MDNGGFEAWYRLEHARVVNSLYLASGSLDVARDAADEAFARALARWSRVRAMASPTGWTFTVGLNLVRREMRRRGKERAAQQLLRSSGGSPVELSNPELWAAVGALPERQRFAVALRYVGHLTELEIAAVMGITRGAVASSLARARETLAAALNERSDVESDIRDA